MPIMHSNGYIDGVHGWFKESGPENDVVLSSRIRLSRNIAGFPFPDKLVLQDEQKIQHLILEAFKAVDSEENFNILSIRDLTFVERQMLFEKKLISRDFLGKINKTVLINKENTESCMIHEQDHMRFGALTGGLNLDTLYSHMSQLFHDLEKYLDFASSLEFGYVNSFVKNAGTGMKASVMLHLPFLAKASLLDRAIQSSVVEGFSVKGFMGDEENSLGDIYQISNEISLGLTEEKYIEQLRMITIALTEYERKARDQYLKSKRAECEDIFYRSYGLLKHCRFLSLKEAIQNLTDFRIGILLGWSDRTLEEINSLLVLLQKAHIQYVIDDETGTDSNNIDYMRSKLAKTYLKLLQ